MLETGVFSRADDPAISDLHGSRREHLVARPAGLRARRDAGAVPRRCEICGCYDDDRTDQMVRSGLPYGGDTDASDTRMPSRLRTVPGASLSGSSGTQIRSILWSSGRMKRPRRTLMPDERVLPTAFLFASQDKCKAVKGDQPFAASLHLFRHPVISSNALNISRILVLEGRLVDALARLIIAGSNPVNLPCRCTTDCFYSHS